ncbi:MAG TPA: ammonium transporter [Acidimicrobiales bacterium]|nr:ammonium transporter [Acidimicrobiales bacterium]
MPQFPPRRRGLKLAIAAGATAFGTLLITSGVAWAEKSPAPDTSTVEGLGIATNILWTTIGAVLVIFMQAGFALVETGFCRAKHAAHVVSTNFAIFGLGFIAYFIVGYSFMFGGYGSSLLDFAAPGKSLIGSGNWSFLWWSPPFLGGSGDLYSAGAMAFFLYMVAFMDTTATIPTGAMAERWKWKAFIGWGLFVGAVYYPLFGAWTWGGGWLASLGKSLHAGFGYVDFAGSGVVHAMGGAAALAGAIVLGPRIGKYGKDGKPRSLAAHHIPMAILGTFILLFGWFGFNAASTLAVTDIRFGVIATNTAIAAAFGSIIAMAWVMLRTDKPDPGMMANGMLAGLVAITAPCAFVQPWAAALIGTVAGVLVVESVWFIERRLKIDDPVGAVSVHGVCGIWGVLSIGLLADGQYGAKWNGTDLGDKGVTGIFYGGTGWGQLAAQAAGALTICIIMFGIAFAFFKLQNRFVKGGIRAEEADELVGMDMPEMGVYAYPQFLPAEEEAIDAGQITKAGEPVVNV